MKHRVAAGESTSKIARFLGCAVEDLVAANPRKQTVRLSSGETVFASLSEGEEIVNPFEGEPRALGAPGTVGFVAPPSGTKLKYPQDVWMAARGTVLIGGERVDPTPVPWAGVSAPMVRIPADAWTAKVTPGHVAIIATKTIQELLGGTMRAAIAGLNIVPGQEIPADWIKILYGTGSAPAGGSKSSYVNGAVGSPVFQKVCPPGWKPMGQENSPVMPVNQSGGCYEVCAGGMVSWMAVNGVAVAMEVWTPPSCPGISCPPGQSCPLPVGIGMLLGGFNFGQTEGNSYWAWFRYAFPFRPFKVFASERYVWDMSGNLLSPTTQGWTKGPGLPSSMWRTEKRAEGWVVIGKVPLRATMSQDFQDPNRVELPVGSVWTSEMFSFPVPQMFGGAKVTCPAGYQNINGHCKPISGTSAGGYGKFPGSSPAGTNGARFMNGPPATTPKVDPGAGRTEPGAGALECPTGTHPLRDRLGALWCVPDHISFAPGQPIKILR